MEIPHHWSVLFKKRAHTGAENTRRPHARADAEKDSRRGKERGQRRADNICVYEFDHFPYRFRAAARILIHYNIFALAVGNYKGVC